MKKPDDKHRPTQWEKIKAPGLEPPRTAKPGALYCARCLKPEKQLRKEPKCPGRPIVTFDRGFYDF